MSLELQCLGGAAILAMLLRIAWMVDKVRVRGLAKVTGYPAESEPLSPLGHRAWIAHEDAVQNLVVFGALVSALLLAGESSTVTRGAAALYFGGRLLHAGAYLWAVPQLKTVGFLAGFGAQVILAGCLVAAIFP